MVDFSRSVICTYVPTAGAITLYQHFYQLDRTDRSLTAQLGGSKVVNSWRFQIDTLTHDKQKHVHTRPRRLPPIFGGIIGALLCLV